MSVLADRIRGKRMAPDMSPTFYKDYQAATYIPVVAIQIYANGLGYNEPLITADGAPVAATSPGQWGQLYAVGRY